MTAARRILAFDQDDAFLKVAGEHLARAGVEFCAVREPSRVLDQVTAFRPDLILLDRAATGSAVGEVTGSLRSSQVPLVFVLADSSERELIRALQSHAVEVMTKPFRQEHVRRILQLLDELDRRPLSETTWEDRVARNFLDLARRHKLRGTLLVNRGTPFEGRVVLKDGELEKASYGPLRGFEAMREILQLEDGVYELDAALERPPQKIAHSATELEPGQTVTLLGPGDSADIRPRLLAVDDEPDMLMLIKKHLSRAGFEVSVAHDGLEAVEAARRTPVDLIMSDLNMPRMDGWEMLKTLKADHRTSEIPVVILSAHDDLRETLRAARAGAHDYLSKTGYSEVIVSAALRAITPRLEVTFHMLVNEPVEVRTQVIGLQWFLRALERLGTEGALELGDDWGSYRLEVKGGQPVSCLARLQRNVTGVPAFARMMVATRAQGIFTPGPIEDPGAGGLGRSLEELITRACEGLNAAEARVTEQRLLAAPEYDVDLELYGLYCRIASPQRVSFAQAVCERQVPFPELARTFYISADQALDWLKELLRRGVIKLRGV